MRPAILLISVMLAAGSIACSSSSPPIADRAPRDQAISEPRPPGEVRLAEGRQPDQKPAVAPHWEAVQGSLAIKEHTATLLKDGRVLIIGGRIDTGSPPVTDKTVFYDPASNSLKDGPPLKQPRMGHTATLLSDGRVVAIGGNSDTTSPLGTSEIYDPGTSSWSDGPPMTSARGGHTATLLPSGDVLVVGGYAYGKHLGSLLLYKFSTGAQGTWASVAAVLNTARSAHEVVQLPTGKLLIVGGAGDTKILDSMEIYDLTSGNMTLLASKLSEPRNLPTVHVLKTGKVLVIGGNDATHDDLYDPALDKVSPISHLGDPPRRHAAAMLADGRVLVCGSDNDPGTRAEIFSTEGGGAWTATAPMKAARYGHSATRLNDGSVLVVGGFYPEWTFTKSLERFFP